MDNEGTGTGTKLIYEELTEKIIGAAIEVHRVLGPGLLESVYQRALCHELKLRNLSFRQQIEVPLHYKGVDLECGFRIDLLLEDTVILELKSVAKYPSRARSSAAYLSAAHKKPVGFIINFNVPVLKYGIVRRVL